MVPSDCCLWASRPWCTSSLSVARPSDLLLTNGMWQKWWDFTSEVRLHGTGISFWGCLQALIFSLACSDEVTMLPAALYRRPRGKELRPSV